VHAARAAMLTDRNQGDEALTAHREASRWMRIAGDAYANAPEHLANVGRCHSNLGGSLSERGRYDEGEDELRRALRIQEDLVAEYPAVAGHRQDLAKTLNHVGLLWYYRNRPGDCYSAYENAAEQLRKVLKDAPDNADAALTLGGTYCNHANAVRAANPAASLALYDRAEAILAPLATAHSPWVGARRFHLNVIRSRARAFALLEREAESLKELGRGLAIAVGVERLEFQADILRAKARHGDEEALSELEKLVRKREANSTLRFHVAMSMGYLAGAAKSPDIADRAAAAALDALRELKGEGYFRAEGNFRNLRLSSAFETVRRRSEFEELLRSPAP
jgi:tetratricopeptide (TPR) repeat protein